MKIAIIDNEDKPVLEYPLEQFINEILNKASGPLFMFRFRKSKMSVLKALADDLIKDFKMQTIKLPPWVK